MLHKFKDHIQQYFPFLTGKKLLIAISGGVDSVVLTQLLQQLHFNITLAHCNFKLRKNKNTLEWKAFDMVVEGISLLSSKQAELSNRIAKEGIETVTLELASITK